MYFGKVALISYLFGIAILAVAYVFIVALNWSVFGTAATQTNLDTIIGRHNTAANQTDTNPEFIFGDYLAAARAVGFIMFDVPTGGVIADVWDAAGGIFVNDLKDAVYYLIRVVLTFCTVCLIINLISGRDL